MGPSEKTQSAIRRSTRLPLEVPVRVTGLSPAVPLSEQCNTTLVNAHGCGVIAPRAITQGIQVRLEIVSAKRSTTARVAEVVSLGGDPETWLVGLELDAPGNFWGIDYAPTDWKIEEPAAPAAPLPVAAESSAPAKAHMRRWRLADISAGACYLETAEPFPAGTPVLLSIRTADTECLLDGTVRVSHAQTGMGVEFTGEPPHERQAQVEELINRLKSNSDVPKIFVGRKEERKPARRVEGRLEGKDDAKDGQHAAKIPAAGATENDELSDSLLELILEGPSLSAEQFLNDLRAQRLGKRRDPRIDLALPVLLTGTDIGGRPLDQRVFTINISRRGALLEGIHGMLRLGDKISLSRAQRREEFRVAWVAGDGTGAAGQIGVAALDPNTSFWSEVLETMVQSRLETASIRDRIRENDRENDRGNSGETGS